VSPGVALVAFAFGSAVLAVWLYVRFPGLAPTQLKHAVAHVVVALVITQLVVGLRLELDVGIEGHAAILVQLFGLLLPVVIYTFLSALWLFALLTSVFRAYGR
jgi:hypothetical protein